MPLVCCLRRVSPTLVSYNSQRVKVGATDGHSMYASSAPKNAPAPSLLNSRTTSTVLGSSKTYGMEETRALADKWDTMRCAVEGVEDGGRRV